ncbi:MAG: hypothetical protein HC845_03815 [Akkermansiaceae bacterium]|nr:hypothetical protein [Akkermansiaceae bacterium]
MKRLISALLLAFTLATSAQTAPAVGSVAENQSFTIFNGGALTDADFTAYDGKILVIMMMTPWCPICQTNSEAVGDGILDFYNKSTRKKLKGKNKNGVAINSLLLSTETAASWDSVNISFSRTNKFKKWGVDSDSNRADPRKLLAYFRGGPVDSSDLNDWGNDRRRVVVINLVRDSPTHAYGQILLNQNMFTSRNAKSARKAIDRVKSATK